MFTLSCPKFFFNSSTDQPTKRLVIWRPTAGHQSTSGTKRKIEDRRTFENVDDGPEVDSGVEEQQKSKKTRVRTDPAQADAALHIGKTYNLKKDIFSDVLLIESDDEDPAGNKTDSEMSELTEMPEETPKPKRGRNTLRRTGWASSCGEKIPS